MDIVPPIKEATRELRVACYFEYHKRQCWGAEKSGATTALVVKRIISLAEDVGFEPTGR